MNTRVFYIRAILLVVLVYQIMPVYSSEPVSTRFMAPRPFGFLIGDLIAHRIEIEIDADLTLKTASLPKPGHINYWLELREPEIRRVQSNGKTHYTIDLLYQTFYAPRQVETLTIPGFTLVFEGGGNAVESVIAPWYFSMSMIRENSIRSAEDRVYIRPDDPPALFETRAPKIRAAVLAGVLILSIAAAAYYFGFLPFSRRRRIFDQALRKLDCLKLAADGSKRMRAMMGIVHRAFDTINGHPLFHDAIEDFLTEHPGFRRIESDIDEFFQASNGLFFAKDAPSGSYSMSQAIDLCRNCRAIERGFE